MKTSFKEKILITQGVTLTASTEKHHFIQIMKRCDTKENYITYLLTYAAYVILLIMKC